MKYGTYTVEHEDDKLLHVRHPDGSLVKVAKGSLGSKLIEKIKGEAVKMADGGPVPQPWEVPVGEGSAGTTVQLPSLAREDIVSQRAEQIRNERAAADAAAFQQAQTEVAQAQQAAEAAAIENEARAKAGLPPLSTPAQQAVPSAQAPLQAPQPMGQAPQIQAQTRAVSGTMPGTGLGGQIGQVEALGRRSAGEKFAAESQQAQEAQQVHQEYADQLAQQQQLYQQHLAGVDKEYSAAVEDFRNAHIDPGRLWNNKTNFQKVSTAIGMVLSGFGSGLSGQSNMAHDMLERAIDNDIESQKAELGKKQTLIGEIYQKYGRTDQADNIARMYLAASVEGKMHVIADRAGTLQAAAARDASVADWQSKFLGLKLQLAQYSLTQSFMRAGMQGGGGYVPNQFGPPGPEEPSIGGVLKAQAKGRELMVPLPEFGQGAHTFARDTKMAQEVTESREAAQQARAVIGRLKQLVNQHRAGLAMPVGQSRDEWNKNTAALSALLPRAFGSTGGMSPKVEQISERIVGGGLGAAIHGPETLDALSQAIGPDLDTAIYSKLGLRAGPRKTVRKIGP